MCFQSPIEISSSQIRQAAEVLDVFQPTETEFDDDGSTSENEDYVETDSAHESEEDADCDDTRIESDGPYISKSGFVWLRKPPDTSDQPSQIQYNATPKGQALNVTTPLEAWSILFTDEILNIILHHTNEEIERTISEIKLTGGYVQSYQKVVDLVELKAVIGLLYFAGLQKLSNTNTKNLWSPYGMSLFRLTIPQSRFVFLLFNMRFDDKYTRIERQSEDCLAKIREIWDMFIANCTANYEPHTNCTIDDQLLSFRGKCLFRTYMPTKPDRYGLKIITLNDSTTHYMHHAIPYIGPVTTDLNEEVPFYYVSKVSEPIHHTGRNITCGNWFTSISIFDQMKEDFNLTMVGTIRKNKREIPEEFKRISPDGTKVRFGYHDEKTLVSFNSKGDKIMLLVSSLPVNSKIDEATGKPEIVNFYDRTKGNDDFDKKCRDYSTARKTRRWPMRYFYGMLDQANVNALILYSSCKNNAKIKRNDFILELSLALTKPFLASRLNSSTLRTTLRVQIEAFLGCKNSLADQVTSGLMVDNRMAKPKRCSYCPAVVDRKTFYKCLRCEKSMCREHNAKICCNCSIELNK